MSELNFSDIKRILCFGSVGGLAAAIHYFTAIMLIEQFYLNPLIANFFAFLIAFIVSYAGQRYWTFNAKNHNNLIKIWRYALTAIIGFCINELILWIGLSIFNLWHPLALLLAILLAAISTYFLSAHWAFKTA